MNKPTSPTSFAFTDAADILAPYIAKERRRDETELARFSTEARRTRGLSFHVGDPPRMRSDEELAAAAQKALEARKAREQSPRGRLHKAICELELLGWGEEAYRLRTLYDQGVSALGMPRRTAGAMLAILNKINHSEARSAVEAIAEMLLSTRRAA